MKKRTAGHTETAISGDTRADWSDAFALVFRYSDLNRRLKKLEAVMTDYVGLVTGSPRWWTYWIEQLYKYIDRDPDARNTKVPLEVLRAYMRDADPDGMERLPPAMLRKRSHELSLEYQRKHNSSRPVR